MVGTLALVGGGEWREGCSFDRRLLESSSGSEVVVIPAGAAYEHPDQLGAAAEAWFAPLGASVRVLDLLSRPDALTQDNVDAVRGARFIYLAGGSSMHLRSVLMHSPVWDALVTSWQDGAVVAGSSAGAMVLCDPMVDQRGGAFTLGLGLLPGIAVVPHADTWTDERSHRTLQLAPAGLLVVAVDERTAVIRDPGGAWRVEGAGEVVAYRDGAKVDLSQLP